MAVPRPRITYANVVSTLALALVLSGTAYAASELPKNSVTSKQIQQESIKGVDVKKNTLTGDQILESALGQVPKATTANTATSATTATTANNATNLGGQPANTYAPRASEAWTTATLNDGSDSGSQASHFGCYWEATDVGVHAPPSFYRDPLGIVHLRGQVKAVDGDSSTCGSNLSADEVIFTLPPGYRPEFRTVLSVMVNSTLGRVNADANGLVRIEDTFPTYTNAKQWLTLDDHSFRCFPSGANGCP